MHWKLVEHYGKVADVHAEEGTFGGHFGPSRSLAR